jgi:hypothetical protein
MSSENDSTTHIENLPAAAQELFQKIRAEFNLAPDEFPSIADQLRYLQLETNRAKGNGYRSAELLAPRREHD